MNGITWRRSRDPMLCNGVPYHYTTTGIMNFQAVLMSMNTLLNICERFAVYDVLFNSKKSKLIVCNTHRQGPVVIPYNYVS